LIVIVIRRFFALLLIPVFLGLFMATLLVFRVNETFLEPDFYAEMFLDVDMFNFVYDEGIPYALADAQQKGNFSTEDLPLGIDLSPDGISLQLRSVLPPDWLEDNLTAVISDALPYITGEADDFHITVAVDDRAEVAIEVFKDLLLEAEIHAYLVGDVVKNQIDRSGALENLPFGMTLTSNQMVQGVVEIVPEPWLKQQVAGVISEITPYLLGRTDTFSITIPVQERAETAIDVVEQWVLTSLAEERAFEYLLQQQIAPAVQDALGTNIELPYGVQFTNGDIVEAIGKILAADTDWVPARVGEVIDAVGPYLVGRTDSFVLVIPLADLAAVAAPVLVDVADSKFEAIYTALRICSVDEMPGLSLSLDSLPPCRPPLVSYALLKGVVGLDVLEQLVSAIVEPLPDSIELTDEQLFAQLATELPVSIDDLRAILRDGYTFSQEDLESLLRSQPADPKVGEDHVALLGDVRVWMRDGFAFDEAELRDKLGGDSQFAIFDTIRGAVGPARENITLLLVLPGMIALMIGWLGGRRWGSRLAWAGVPVLISGLIATIGLGPVAEFGSAKLDDVIRGMDLSSIFIGKILDVRLAVESSFIAPMATDGATAAAGGAVMVVVGLMFARTRKAKVRVPKKNAPVWQTETSRDAKSVIDSLKDELASED
jgi:hypothetical protein